MNKWILYGNLLAGLLLFNKTFSQQAQTDSTIENFAAKRAIQLYSEKLASQLAIYNGIEYVPEVEGYVKGYPYFLSDVMEEGTIIYDEVIYNNIPLLYDISKDYLLIEQEGSAQRIKLHNEKIQGFILAGHTFVHIQADTASQSAIRTGFYEQLYTGELHLYAKRTKNIQQATRGVTKEYLSKNTYFILKQHSYYPVKNKSSLLKLLKEQKKELQKYLRDNKINFGQDPEYAMIKLVEQYDRLANPL